MPVLFQACQESELAEEYQAGSQSYGVFTYCLAKSLRTARADSGEPSFQELFDQAGVEIKRLGHSQQPAIVGPTAVLKLPVPLSISEQQTEAAERKAPRKGAKTKPKPRRPKAARKRPRRPAKKQSAVRR